MARSSAGASAAAGGPRPGPRRPREPGEARAQPGRPVVDRTARAVLGLGPPCLAAACLDLLGLDTGSLNPSPHHTRHPRGWKPPALQSWAPHLPRAHRPGQAPSRQSCGWARERFPELPGASALGTPAAPHPAPRGHRTFSLRENPAPPAERRLRLRVHPARSLPARVLLATSHFPHLDVGPRSTAACRTLGPWDPGLCPVTAGTSPRPFLSLQVC